MSADWAMEQLYFKWFQLLVTNDKQVKCKHDESMTKQSIFVEYIEFEFCWNSLADEHNTFPNRPGEM